VINPNLCGYLALTLSLVGKLLNLLVALHLGCLGCEAFGSSLTISASDA
tara:strand:- start:23886 stop:24032 length:147 start_codon:yes stop_codon:yes gene_type:complete